ncbi:anti-sigma factor RsiW [Kibdelosporangium banguiense]|uniref:Anti-sigma factor RsiW n=1 Tax=Kibdelosporangium banguiense TaxID=1365924 RepID=A0ABS4TXP2_9PSEU|nr:zf-HC2 domain-containing protein [Kibdelosporangium banguiense]MBP2329170.1 anti-sigma factor RsiW [Kibdelosporangium banguiense]
MTHACPYTVTVGAYVLGVLGERENTEFRRHAAGCPHCQQEITELTPAVRFLEKLKSEMHAANGNAP